MRHWLSRHKRLVFVSVTLLALILTLWETNRFLQEFKKEEKAKTKILTLAYQKLIEAKPNDSHLLTLSSNILESNHTIPIIIIDQDSTVVFHRNFKSESTEYLLNKAKKFADADQSFYLEIDKNTGKYQRLYYGKSSLSTKLTYYPIVLVLIFLLFTAVIYQYYRTGKISDENRLWSGLAKETAHQIGTPLSSLIGWVEILKQENNPDLPIEEIEKDIQRLNIISQRFSKIGSTPELSSQNISEVTRKTLQYLKNRISKLIEIDLIENTNEKVLLNENLYSWVIENLVKNAIDAMDGKGKITIITGKKKQVVFVDITDSGRGIESSNFKRIFMPGYTTKKRGWGLGLSLAKRIIEQYHKGKIYVKESKIGEGTTFRIEFKTTGQ
jgi:sensor histidine kinase YesM